MQNQNTFCTSGASEVVIQEFSFQEAYPQCMLEVMFYSIIAEDSI